MPNVSSLERYPNSFNDKLVINVVLFLFTIQNYWEIQILHGIRRVEGLSLYVLLLNVS